MVPHYTHIYRQVLRELAKGSVKPRSTRNKDIASNFRVFFAGRGQSGDASAFQHDMQNVLTFMKSQREYKALLERYNPLIDLTAKERIEATARRVGLNMPKMAQGE